MILKDYNFVISDKLIMIAILYGNISFKVTKNAKLQNSRLDRSITLKFDSKDNWDADVIEVKFLHLL